MKKIKLFPDGAARVKGLVLSVFALLFVLFTFFSVSKAWFSVNSKVGAEGIGLTAVDYEGTFSIMRWDEDGYTLCGAGETADAGKTYYEYVDNSYTALNPQPSEGISVSGYYTPGEWLTNARWVERYGRPTADLSGSVPNETIRFKLVSRNSTLSSFNITIGDVVTVVNTDAGVNEGDIANNNLLDYIYAAIVSDDTAYTTLNSEGAITNSAVAFSENSEGILTLNAATPSIEIIFDIYIHREVSNHFSLWSFSIEFTAES